VQKIQVSLIDFIVIFGIIIFSFPLAFASPQSIPEELFQNAIQAIKNSEFEKAIIIFDQILEIDPTHLNSLINKGSALIKLEKYDEAIIIFDKILERYPNNQDAKENRNIAFSQIMLSPVINSGNLDFVHIVVRDSNGFLVSVTESDTVFYLEHKITEEFLDSILVAEIVEKDGKSYEKRIIKTNYQQDQYTFLSSTSLASKKFNEPIEVFRVWSHSIVIEKGDIATAEWTILKSVPFL